MMPGRGIHVLRAGHHFDDVEFAVFMIGCAFTSFSETQTDGNTGCVRS